MKYFFYFIILIIINLDVQAQTLCGSDALLETLKKNNPYFEQSKKISEQVIYQALKANKFQKSGGIINIPVVVHIIHNEGVENISDAQVKAGIAHLNEAFKNSGFYQSALGVDIEIEFCLAQRDEQGNATTGINRIKSTLTNMTAETQDIALKNLSRWNPLHYINVWLVKEITSVSMGKNVAGYAFLPQSHGTSIDGIVNEAAFWGSNKNNSKIHIHEFGHYLGLYHTFQGGCKNNDCLKDGDLVCDTPPDNSVSPISCSSSINTCHTDEDDQREQNPFRSKNLGGLGDQPDMFQNYMDYGFQTCQTAFTQGQKDRMQAAINQLRGSLLESKGCLSPCLSQVKAIFSYPIQGDKVNVGTSITFTNTSATTRRQWYLNGKMISEDINLTYLFIQVGTFEIKLKVWNESEACADEKTVKIQVICTTQSTFTYLPNETALPLNSTVTFTSTSIGASSYQWLIDRKPFSSNSDFIYEFKESGYYDIQLVTYNGACYDTSKVVYFEIGICKTDKRNNIWYFGDKRGIDFNFNPPKLLTDGVMYAPEGCSSIADEEGKLLFYSNGEKIWNSKHQIMANGDSLLGHSSAVQACMIIPSLEHPTKYLVFVLDAGENNNFNGLSYNIVDMSSNNGLGSVIIKNIRLVSPTKEALTATYHRNQKDIWVVAVSENNQSYYSYLLTKDGVQDPVITNIVDNPSCGWPTLKISSNGKKLATINYCTPYDLPTNVRLFDFNNETGILSNYMDIPFGGGGNEREQISALEFSPDNSKLYAGSFWLRQNSGRLVQYDLSEGTYQKIRDSYFELNVSSNETFNHTGWGTLQLAPDGKIYTSSGYYNDYRSNMSAILNPNLTKDKCNFVLDYLEVNNSTFPAAGLPNQLIPINQTNPLAIQGQTSVCEKQIVTYRIFNQPTNLVNEWEVIGDVSIINKTPTEITLAFNSLGEVILKSSIKTECTNSLAELKIRVENLKASLGQDVLICKNETAILKLDNEFQSYRWSNGSGAGIIVVDQPGKYWVTAYNNEGCMVSDTIEVKQDNQIPFNLGTDISICEGKPITLDAGKGFTNYLWSDGSTLPTLTTFRPGKYWVKASNRCITVSDTIQIAWAPILALDLGADFGICPGDKVVLQAPDQAPYILWQDGSTKSTFTTTQPGTYWVALTNEEGCSVSDTIAISIDPSACPDPLIPNVITPNGDDKNEYLDIGENVSTFTLIIFNRLGQVVYKTDHYQNDWNAQGLGNDVYFYELINNDSKKKYKGWVSVLR
jgi:gliding motility-associated-like protein